MMSFFHILYHFLSVIFTTQGKTVNSIRQNIPESLKTTLHRVCLKKQFDDVIYNVIQLSHGQ